MDEFYIGKVFKERFYPPEAAEWCNQNGTCHIEENEDGKWTIVENRRIVDNSEVDPNDVLLSIAQLYSVDAEEAVTKILEVYE